MRVLDGHSGQAYDVAIAGASFAGLSTALQVRGRVLVLDHRPVGEGQTSACGTTVAALRRMDALHTIQQVHHDLILHLTPASGPSRRLRYRFPTPFCTFDYRALCRTLAARAAAQGVQFARARVVGWRDGALLTDRGRVDARCVVDATGWRAAVASSLDPAYVRSDRLSCGLEAELPQPATNRATGLHFWAGQGTVWPGYAWSFPAGPVARLGVIAYPVSSPDVTAGPPAGRPGSGSAAPDAMPRASSSKGLREALDAFLDGPGAEYWSADGRWPWRSGSGTPTGGRHLHGGFLPCAPRRPVVGPVFVVGDAAGHCIGLTGEGIRPALSFAVRCGRLLQETVEGRATPEEARRRYARAVTLRHPALRLLHALQRRMTHASDRGLSSYSQLVASGPAFAFLMSQYLLPFGLAR
jgi:flavin-dependent dehydrogenase